MGQFTQWQRTDKAVLDRTQASTAVLHEMYSIEDLREIDNEYLISKEAPILCTFPVLAAVVFVPNLQPEQTRPKPAVVQIDKTPRGVAYKVDSEPTGRTPTTDLLYALNQVHKRAASTTVVVIIDPHVPITEIWNFEGVAAKAQLTNLRYFVFNRETEMMAELKWGPAVPFSTSPTVE